MLLSKMNNLEIKGLACCVPKQKDLPKNYTELFGADKVKKFMNMTGVKEKHNAIDKQTASDLAYIAAEKLLSEKEINREEIGVIIFVTETPDYQTPSTAFVLQHRLNLSKQCFCFDMNMGCTGFVSGFLAMASIMNNMNVSKGLLLFGDTMTKKLSPQDRSICMLLGDAGGVLLLEKVPDAKEIVMTTQSDGAQYGLAIIPAGGSRNPDADATRTEADDGNIRGPYDFYMDGANIFFYSTSDVVKFLQSYMKDCGKTIEDYDALILHQANELIIKNFAKRSKFPINKVPISIDRFGNTVGASIPVTLCDRYGKTSDLSLQCLMCGFGTGLSCGIIDAEINTSNILPLIYSDEYFQEAL